MRDLKGRFMCDKDRYITLLELRIMFLEMKLGGKYNVCKK